MARVGVAALLIASTAFVLVAFGQGPRSTEEAAPTTPTTAPIEVLAETVTSTTTLRLPPAIAGNKQPVPAATTTTTVSTVATAAPAPASTTTTTRPLPTTTTTASPTTTTRPSTTTTTTRPTTTTTTKPPPTTTTTTTTTLPPTTTTTTVPPTTTTTTTVPPTTTTTTTVPTDVWYPILGASAFCEDETPVIRWSVADPDTDWSDGWQLVIDADNRGVYQPGTIVTSSGGPAVAFEAVEPGTHTLRIEIHFERLLIGNRDRGYGTWSVTTTAEDCS